MININTMKPNKLNNEVLNLLYELEILHDYNETETGLKIGLVINKLQKELSK